MARCRHNIRGFTLAECLMASVVLAAAVVGIAGSLSASYQQSAVHGDAATALDLARELMEEVAAKPFDPPSGAANAAGWPTVTDRTLYDTIGDYNGYEDNAGSLVMFNGSAVDASNGGTFARRVTVENTVPTGLAGTASDFAVVTVTVRTGHDDVVTLTQVCTRATVVRGQ
jgi:prepilin-type N-terminal cleavage/methylation domain-containing protein